MPKIINDEEVFRETCKMLVQKGFEGMTTKELAIKTKIDESSLFRKYGSKANLVCKAVNYIFYRVPLAQLNYSGELECDLLSIIDSYQNTVLDYGPLLQVVILEIPRNPDLQNAVASVRNNISSMVSIINKHQKRGLLKKGDPMDFLISLIGPLAMNALNPLSIKAEETNTFDSHEYLDRFLSGHKINI